MKRVDVLKVVAFFLLIIQGNVLVRAAVATKEDTQLYTCLRDAADYMYNEAITGGCPKYMYQQAGYDTAFNAAMTACPGITLTNEQQKVQDKYVATLTEEFLISCYPQECAFPISHCLGVNLFAMVDYGTFETDFCSGRSWQDFVTCLSANYKCSTLSPASPQQNLMEYLYQICNTGTTADQACALTYVNCLPRGTDTYDDLATFSACGTYTSCISAADATCSSMTPALKTGLKTALDSMKTFYCSTLADKKCRGILDSCVRGKLEADWSDMPTLCGLAVEQYTECSLTMLATPLCVSPNFIGNFNSWTLATIRSSFKTNVCAFDSIYTGSTCQADACAHGTCAAVGGTTIDCTCPATYKNRYLIAYPTCAPKAEPHIYPWLARSRGNCSYVKRMSRADWGALAPTKAGTARLKPRILRVFIAGTGDYNCYNNDDCKRAMKVIQKKHMTTLGFGDVGFHYVFTANGLTIEGMAENQKSPFVQVPEYQEYSLVIGLTGFFNVGNPPPKQMRAWKDFVHCLKLDDKMKTYFTIHCIDEATTGPVEYGMTEACRRAMKLGHFGGVPL